MRLKRFKNLNSGLQILVLSGLIFVLVASYIPLSKYIKPAIASLLTHPLKFCEGISSNARQFLKFQDLVEENKRLKARVDRLTAQSVQLQEVSQENQRLRDLLSLSKKATLRTHAALLIGKDSSNWTRTVMINIGALSGVKKGMPVIYGAGLVGRVVEVAPNVSKVSLITDFNSKIPAKILRTREEGVVFGDSYRGRNVCKMKYIHNTEIGDKVVSSSLGGIYPKGFLIGEVVAVEEEKNRLYKVVEIQPAVEFSTLEEVMVITGP